MGVAAPAPRPAGDPAGAGEPGFGLYVHWPFCRAKCPYCDFNSHVATLIDHARWARALLRELDHFAAETAGRTLTSIFFGGGTPSLMEPATCAALIDRAAERLTFAPDIEITLEANPTSVEAGRLAGFRAAGVNRVSLGVQALDDGSLRALGREHGAAEALAAVDLAARLFPRFSFDLIYARPGQTAAAWEAELDRALAHAGGHLSVYQLTIEPGTRFHALHARGALRLPPDEIQAELYELTRDRLAAAGLPAYEVSNHARPGEESRHNLTYWRSGDWLGIGPGAHGRLTLEGGARVGTETARMPRAWLERVERAGHAERPREPLSAWDQAVELLLMGLRLTEGIALDRLESTAARPLDRVIDPAALRRFAADGLLASDGGRLRATPLGLQRLNALLGALLRDPTPVPAGRPTAAAEG
ncbi:MAG TPA: radical SAM family heme chaperone HemW [Geminicoccaceae bacterium]|nr:radical SAM family heme chaperone HemW [Geminicoccaceae bacterium]